MPKLSLSTRKCLGVSVGFPVAIGLVWFATFGGLSGCRRPPQKKVGRAPAPVALCPGGVSEDPPRRELEPAVRAFDEKRYRDAQEALRALAQKNPTSGSLLVWLGDALLYDKDKSDDEAARQAIAEYDAAELLHQKGCSLPRRQRYYGLMGSAYARLRLAKPGGEAGRLALSKAEVDLGALEAEFPTSAEVPYAQARAACLRAQLESGPGVDALVLRCRERFEKTIAIANGYERPRFLRTHRSTQDWLVRAETQSEFGPLRADAAYQRFIRATVRAAE
jgi:hypothetical protein